MPRRSSTRTAIIIEPPPHRRSPALPPSYALPEDVVQLRNQWKWATFSQFFFTFSHLFAMNDVTLTDIEDDLTHSTNVVLPRIMQRLLYTLSYDRKVSLDNWQTALRKQYYKRDPLANPLGSEPSSSSLEPRSTSFIQDPNTPSPAAEPRAEEAADSAIQGSLVSSNETATYQPIVEGTVDSNNRELSFQLEDNVAPQPEQAFRKAVDDQHEAENEESTDWLDLPMLAKLDSMHLLTEWQFHNPIRLRSLMKTDDETAQWRIEPIGYDAKRNAYWLIGGTLAFPLLASRLWIQRALPNPPKTSLKRKRPAAGDTNNTAANSKHQPASTKRPRLQADEGTTQKSHKIKTGSRSAQNHNANNNLTDGGGGRAAKAQANLKLDEQAKELAELNRQAATLARSGGGGETKTSKRPKVNQRSKSSGMGSSPTRPLGTRISTRLRGAQGDEWQPVPEEWLNEGAIGTQVNGGQASGSVKKPFPKTGLESDEESVSDLTELSEFSEGKETDANAEALKDEDEDTNVRMVDVEMPVPTDDRGVEEVPILPEGFIEWETICATLYEWEHIAERFDKATNYSEKTLYKVLANDVVPSVTEELREIDRQRRLQEALVHRKRSSRIAIKESEKEEARLAARKRAEEEDKMSRARRLEARLQKEEADRERRENAREQRRREREAKEALQKESGGESSDMQIDIIGDGPPKNALSNGSMTFHQGKIRFHGAAMNGSGSGSRTPLGDDWELDCEICYRRGINIDDGTPMMCCGICCKWQHIACHDRADIQAGRSKRNWDDVEFFCRQCRSRTASNYIAGSYQPQPQMGQSASTSYLTLRPPIPTEATSNPQVHSPTNYVAQRSSDNYMGARIHSMPTNGGVTYRQGQLSPVPYPQPHPQPPHPQPQQRYPLPHTTIAFTHYQPQQRGFSSSSQIPHNSAHTQPYGQPSSGQFAYPDVGTNGQLSNSYQRSVPHTQAGWNVTTPAHAPGYGTLYNASGERSGIATYVQEAERQYGGRPDAMAPHDHDRWQPPRPHTSANAGEQPLNQFSATQFRYHPTSYQSPS